MRRAALLTFALALAASGCGGGKSTETTAPVTTAVQVTTTSGDPGRDAIEAFVAAARSGNADALWGMLSTGTRARLGGTLAKFRTGASRELAGGVGAFRTFHVVVSERVTPEFGVVAIDGTRLVKGKPKQSVYAVALQLEGKTWKLDLGGPVKVRAIGPDPGARERVVAQIAAAVSGPAGSGTAVMYLDGGTLQPQVRGTPSNSTMFANFDSPLDAGRHTVVVFAAADRDASATAWDFTVTKKP